MPLPAHLGEEIQDVPSHLGEEISDTAPVSHGASGSWEPEPEKSWLASLGNYAKEALSSLNPVTIAKGAVAASNNPIGAVDSILKAQGELETKAEEAFKRGDWKEGVRHALHYLIPILGPRMDQASDLLAQGETAKGLGAATDVGLQVAIPKVLSSIPSVRTPALLRNPNPVAADAVAFAQAQGIPVDAATATGNRAVQGGQWLADRSMAGSPVASVMEQRSADALARVGNQLAERANPSAASSAEQAGAAINGTLEDKMAALHEEANKHYAAVRAAEANPANATTISSQRPSQILSPTGQPLNVPVSTTIPLMVDLAPSKAALQPLFERLQRQYPVTIRESSPGFKALQNIMEGPDAAPLSQVDSDLGAIKSIARGADLPELKSISQGVAAKSVRELSDAVLQAATKAGPKVLDSLERGREATKAKYETRAIWDRIRKEPVGAFNQMVLPKDAGIELLGEVNRLAPTEVPKVARAFLDNLIGEATSEGGFGKRGTIANKWDKLGPQTKKMLFKDPEYISDLDNFFRYARMSGFNPNPSGSGHIVSLLAQGEVLIRQPQLGVPLQIGGAALASLLRSPAGVKLLTKGLRVPVGNKVAGAAIASELSNLVGQQQE